MRVAQLKPQPVDWVSALRAQRERERESDRAIAHRRELKQRATNRLGGRDRERERERAADRARAPYNGNLFRLKKVLFI